MSQKDRAGAQGNPEGASGAPVTFRESFGVLQRHVETLRNQREPDIDSLLPIVTESMAAFKVCKERLDAVEKALEEVLGEDTADATGSRGRPA